MLAQVTLGQEGVETGVFSLAPPVDEREMPISPPLYDLRLTPAPMGSAGITLLLASFAHNTLRTTSPSRSAPGDRAGAMRDSPAFRG